MSTSAWMTSKTKARGRRSRSAMSDFLPSRNPVRLFAAAVLMTAIGSWPATHAAKPAVEADVPVPQAEFLLLGSYHMNNPGRDVHNTRADDVLTEQRDRKRVV